MCDFSTAVRAEGRAEGREEGKALMMIDNINNVMQSFGMTLEQVLNILKISQEEYMHYKEIASEINKFVS